MDHLEIAKDVMRQLDDVSLNISFEQWTQTAPLEAIAHALIAIVEQMRQETKEEK